MSQQTGETYNMQHEYSLTLFAKVDAHGVFYLAAICRNTSAMQTMVAVVARQMIEIKPTKELRFLMFINMIIKSVQYFHNGLCLTPCELELHENPTSQHSSSLMISALGLCGNEGACHFF